jgi:hypothetical protein
VYYTQIFSFSLSLSKRKILRILLRFTPPWISLRPFISSVIFAQLEENIATDLIRALPDNGSVNSPTYTGGQQNSGGVF